MWKAWITSLIGAAIPILTGIISDLVSGHINWDAMKMSFIAFGVLAFTDLLREVQQYLGVTTTTVIETPTQTTTVVDEKTVTTVAKDTPKQ